MSTTPNMQLDLPVVGSTPGPDWADLLNQAFGLIDTHDHSDGKGVKITPAGLNINADLDFGANQINNLNALNLNSITGQGFSNVFQNGGDLYWRNGNGNNVQITSGGAINVGSLGTIGGDYSTDPNNPLITFTTSSGDYDFYKDTTGAPIPAGLNTGIITIFQEIAGANGITIQSPNSLAAAYSITLPIAQAGASNSLVQSQGSGQWSYTRNPTADTLGIGQGGLGSSSWALYFENNPTLGLYSSAVNNWDFGTADTRALNINENQSTTFFPGEVSDFIPSNPGEVKVGNAAIGNAEVALSMYSSGASGWNRFIGVMGVSDDTGSNPVVQHDVRRNTGTGFGTRSLLYRFSNNDDPLLDIERTRLKLYRTGDDDVLSLFSDGTENTVRQYFRNSDDSRNFNFSSFFTSGSEVLNIQSDSETFMQFFRGGNVATSKLFQASNNGSASTPTIAVGANNTGLYNDSNNPSITRLGVKRFSIGSSAVTFFAGADLGDSGSERLGTFWGSNVNLTGDIDVQAVTCTDLAPSGTLTQKLVNGTSTTFTTNTTTGTGSPTGKVYHYQRVGSVVNVSGRLVGTFTLNGSGVFQIEIDVPIGTTFTASTDAAGSISPIYNTVIGGGGGLAANIINNRVTLTVNGTGSTIVNQIGFAFNYKI